MFVFKQPLQQVHAIDIFHNDGQVLEVFKGADLSYNTRMWLLIQYLSDYNLCSYVLQRFLFKTPFADLLDSYDLTVIVNVDA